MNNIIRQIIWISLFLLSNSLYAFQWIDLWRTADQQGKSLLQAGKAQAASLVFKNKDWQAVSLYRSGNYSEAQQKFSEKKTSDAQYNAGNAAALGGHYQEAIAAYDKAIALNPNNTDAIFNRDIIKKLMNKKKQNQNNCSCNQSKNNSSANNANDNKQDKDKKDNKNNNSSSSSLSASSSPSESQKNKDQNKNSSTKNDSQKQNSQGNSQKGKNNQEEVNQQSKINNLSQNQADKSGSKSNNTKFDSKESSSTTSRPLQNTNSSSQDLQTGERQTKEEDKKQLLRRLADDPGGLLRQKFLRDYFRRHASGENRNQGAN